MSKYDLLIHKIQENLQQKTPLSFSQLTFHEWELIEEALITLRFLETLFKKRSQET